MSYGIRTGSTIWQRIDRIETIICEQMIRCAEIGSEAMNENDLKLSDQMMDRHEQLELRFERVQHIAAKYSARFDYS